jgi:hypothetical protein
VTAENWHLMQFGVGFFVVLFVILLWVGLVIFFRKIDVDRMVGFATASAIFAFAILMLALAYKTLK